MAPEEPLEHQNIYADPVRWVVDQDPATNPDEYVYGDYSADQVPYVEESPDPAGDTSAHSTPLAYRVSAGAQEDQRIPPKVGPSPTPGRRRTV